MGAARATPPPFPAGLYRPYTQSAGRTRKKAGPDVSRLPDSVHALPPNLAIAAGGREDDGAGWCLSPPGAGVCHRCGARRDPRVIAVQRTWVVVARVGHCHGAWDVRHPAQALTACVDGDRRTTTGLVRLATLSSGPTGWTARARVRFIAVGPLPAEPPTTRRCGRAQAWRTISGMAPAHGAPPGVETRHPGRYTSASSATLNFTLACHRQRPCRSARNPPSRALAEMRRSSCWCPQ